MSTNSRYMSLTTVKNRNTPFTHQTKKGVKLFIITGKNSSQSADRDYKTVYREDGVVCRMKRTNFVKLYGETDE